MDLKKILERYYREIKGVEEEKNGVLKLIILAGDSLIEVHTII